MDTSREYSSPTLDFLSGDGTNLPKPSHLDYAHRLIQIGNRLDNNLIIKVLAEDTPLNEKHPLFDKLHLIQDSDVREDVSGGSFVEIESPRSFRPGISGTNGVITRVFLGNGKWSSVFWIVTEELGELATEHEIKPISCAVLDINSMVALFKKFEKLNAWSVPLAEYLLQSLCEIAQKKEEYLQDTLYDMSHEASILQEDLKLFNSAREAPQPLGFGITD